MKYIQFTKWKEFQQNKYRNNPWIRLYTDLTDEYDKNGQVKQFFGLKAVSKLTFFMLLCAANKFNNNIPYKNGTQLRRLLGISKFDLQELVECNYIVISENNCGTQSDQSQINGTVTVTDTVTDTEQLIPTAELINEGSATSIKTHLSELTARLYNEKIFPEVNKFVNAMIKKKKNKRAILHTLIRCYTAKPENAWGYCEKIIQVEDGNYYERDYKKTS